MRFVTLGLLTALSWTQVALKRNYESCIPQYKTAGVSDPEAFARILDRAQGNKVLAQIDEAHSQMAQSLESPTFSISKDDKGKETISISFGNIRAPWKPEDYQKYFEQVCKQRHPDKDFCTKALVDKYDRWMKWLGSPEIQGRLQPIIDKMLNQPGYNPRDDILALRIDKRNPSKDDPIIKTIGEFGWDPKLFIDPQNPWASGLTVVTGSYGFPQFLQAANENGAQTGVYVIQVHNLDSNQVEEYLTYSENGRSDGFVNPLYFTGVEAKVWNCYVQKRLGGKRLYLHGKAVC